MILIDRLIPCAVATIGGAAVVGQAEGALPIPYGEWTALGCLCFIVVWLITKTLPGIVREQRESSSESHQEFSRTLASIADKHDTREQQRDEALKTMAGTLSEIQRNCVIAQQLAERRTNQT